MGMLGLVKQQASSPNSAFDTREDGIFSALSFFLLPTGHCHFNLGVTHRPRDPSREVKAKALLSALQTLCLCA